MDAMSKSIEVLLIDNKSRYMLGNTTGGRDKYIFSCHFFSVTGMWSKEKTDLIFYSRVPTHPSEADEKCKSLLFLRSSLEYES